MSLLLSGAPFLCDPHYVSDFGFLGSPHAQHLPRQRLRPIRQPEDVAISRHLDDCYGRSAYNLEAGP
jgi:hypothetical protein